MLFVNYILQKAKWDAFFPRCKSGSCPLHGFLCSFLLNKKDVRPTGQTFLPDDSVLQADVLERKMQRVAGDQVVLHAVIQPAKAPLYARPVQMAVHAAAHAVLREQPRKLRPAPRVFRQQDSASSQKRDALPPDAWQPEATSPAA